MAFLSIKTPAPFKTNRRKCGWGSALTTCDICGRPMMGHNRGICSRCMRSLGMRGDTILTPQRVGIHHLCSSGAVVKRAQAEMMRTLAFAEAEKRNAKTAATNSIRREVK